MLPIKDNDRDTEKGQGEKLEKDLSLQRPPILKVLVEARTTEKKTIAHLSKALNVSVRYLRAIEEGDTSALPEDAYTLGFVRSYANYFKLEAGKCVKDYKEQILSVSGKKPDFSLPSMPQESMAPKRALLILSFVVVICGYMGWLYVSEKQELKEKNIIEEKTSEEEHRPSSHTSFLHSEPEVEDPFEFEDQPVDSKTEDAQKKQAAAIEATLKGEKPADFLKSQTTEEKNQNQAGSSSSSSEIIIHASQRSWIEIKDKEKILYRGILKEGENYPVPAGESLLFSTGNAGGITFSINGTTTPALGHAGQVVRKVPLTKDSLSSVGKLYEPEKKEDPESHPVEIHSDNSSESDED